MLAWAAVVVFLFSSALASRDGTYNLKALSDELSKLIDESNSVYLSMLKKFHSNQDVAYWISIPKGFCGR
jgi:hypothetical protein